MAVAIVAPRSQYVNHASAIMGLVAVLTVATNRTNIFGENERT